MLRCSGIYYNSIPKIQNLVVCYPKFWLSESILSSRNPESRKIKNPGDLQKGRQVSKTTGNNPTHRRPPLLRVGEARKLVIL